MDLEVETVTVEDIIHVPGRFMRPPKIAIILRGPPGSGKTTMAKMIKVRLSPFCVNVD